MCLEEGPFGVVYEWKRDPLGLCMNGTILSVSSNMEGCFFAKKRKSIRYINIQILFVPQRILKNHRHIRLRFVVVSIFSVDSVLVFFVSVLCWSHLYVLHTTLTPSF